MVCYTDISYLKTVLSGSEASRYLNSDSKQTASSILAVLAANSKPLKYLSETSTEKIDKIFSMKQYFADCNFRKILGRRTVFRDFPSKTREITKPKNKIVFLICF